MTMLIQAERLRGFVADAYQAAGISEGDAHKIAGLQTEADLRGADGHGVFRLPGVERIWLPGEQSHAKRIERAKNGIPIPDPLLANLNKVAQELGVGPLA